MSYCSGTIDKQLAPSLTAASGSFLVAAAQKGGHLAYVELCRRHRDMMLRAVLRITRNMDDAEDVLQDSWMKAFIHLGTFDGRSAFSTWMTKIATNSAISMIRKRRSQREFSLDDSVDPDGPRLMELMELSHNPEEHCLETEKQRLLRQAIQHLPSELRTAIEIRQSQDGSINDIAIMAGISAPKMKLRLIRARHTLRKRLRRY
jgi:RNA polymerase sigma factor (sigma-70 family)